VQPRPIGVTSAAPRRRIPERARTALVLVLAGAVAIAAAADALRGGRHPAAAPPPPPTQRHAAFASLPRPPRGLLPGSLWYADPRCRLHRVDLATGHDRLVTASGGHCRFWVSPDRREVAMHSGRPFVAPQAVELLNVATGAITAPFRRPDLALAPPAWSPDSRTLVVCDGSRGPPALRAYHLTTGRLTTPAGQGCDPGYVGPRLAFRALNLVTRVGWHRIANARTLASLLHRDVQQTPAPTSTGAVLAIPATTITPAGGAPPVTTVVLFDAGGHVTGMWDTGGLAQGVALLDGGRVIAATRRDGVVLEDRRTASVVTSVQGRPIVADAVSPRGDVLALADGRQVVFASMSGRPAFALPIHTRWIEWTRSPPN
jgi:hypothetical protein